MFRFSGKFADVSMRRQYMGGDQYNYLLASGRGTIQNEGGDVIARGELQNFGSWIALEATVGASFEFRPGLRRLEGVSWPYRAGEPAQLTFDGDKRWTIDSGGFFLLLKPRSVMEYEVQIVLAESIARASLVTLPTGRFELFGYEIEVPSKAARIRFTNGVPQLAEKQD